MVVVMIANICPIHKGGVNSLKCKIRMVIMGSIRLMCGDSATLLFTKVEKNSVDLVVTSPPYDDLRSYKNGNCFNHRVFYGIANGLWHVVKDGGVIVWIVNDATIKGTETGTSFKQALFFKEIGFNLHDTMIYRKNNPVPLTHNRYEQEFEYMFIFSKGKPETFLPKRIKCRSNCIKNYNTMKSASAKEKRSSFRPRIEKRNILPTKQAGNIWSYSVGGYSSAPDRLASNHPAIFPEALVVDQIKTWSKPGDIVLDPMMGSGTVGKVSNRMGRNFIGIDIEREYFILSKKRIKESMKELR